MSGWLLGVSCFARSSASCNNLLNDRGLVSCMHWSQDYSITVAWCSNLAPLVIWSFSPFSADESALISKSRIGLGVKFCVDVHRLHSLIVCPRMLLHGRIQTDSGALDPDYRQVRGVAMLVVWVWLFPSGITSISISPGCDVQSTEFQTVWMTIFHTSLLQRFLTYSWHEWCILWRHRNVVEAWSVRVQRLVYRPIELEEITEYLAIPSLQVRRPVRPCVVVYDLLALVD